MAINLSLIQHMCRFMTPPFILRNWANEDKSKVRRLRRTFPQVDQSQLRVGYSRVIPGLPLPTWNRTEMLGYRAPRLPASHRHIGGIRS